MRHTSDKKTSHPFGELISQILSRKRLSQKDMALGVNCDSGVISRMCNGKNLYTPAARRHIVNIIEWFLKESIPVSLNEANTLLEHAKALGLLERDHREKKIIDQLVEREIIRGDTLSSEKVGFSNVRRPINNLPNPTYEVFIGRSLELNKIIESIMPGSEKKRTAYPISIDGIGGIGKSSLALAVGYYFINNHNSRGFEYIVWVSAKDEWLSETGIAPKSVNVQKTLVEILKVISKTLGFSEAIESQPKNEWAEIVYEKMKNKRILLIVDNLETIDDDSVISFIRDLPPNVRILLTTRRRVDFATSFRLEQMKREDAFKLIENCSTRVSLDDVQKEMLYDRTGGVPLILIWSMAQVNEGMPVEIFLKKIASAHAKNIEKYCFDQNISTIKKHVYYYELLQALSVFDTGATRTTIGMIAGGGLIDEVTLYDGLIFLEKLAMVTKSNDKFSLLPATRKYLVGLLEEDQFLKNKIFRNLASWVNLIIVSELDDDIIEYLNNERLVLSKVVEYLVDQKEYHTASEIISFVKNKIVSSQDEDWLRKIEALRETSKMVKPPKIDWDGAPAVDIFYGRLEEVEKIKDWIVLEKCKLVSVFGFGGMGKSFLVSKVARGISNNYHYVIWRSLANGTPPDELFLHLLQFLVDMPNETIPDGVDERLNLLINYFTKYKCLIVLDDFDSVLVRVGKEKSISGYEYYEKFLLSFEKESNESCLIITSREKPLVFFKQEHRNPKVRSLPIEGLKKADLEALLLDNNVLAMEDLLITLVGRYSGSPLAAMRVVNLQKEKIDGDINSKLHRNIDGLIGDEIMRLPAPEREVLTWLAIEREPVDLITLHGDIISANTRDNIQTIVEHLIRRSLIEVVNNQIILRPFLINYMTDNLISEIVEEILSGQINEFCIFVLLKAQAKDHIRNAQSAFIIAPIIQKLVDYLGGQKDFFDLLNKTLEIVKKKPQDLHGYAIGNILNLLAHAEYDLERYDFSHTNISQAFLRSTNLHDVNFAQSNFENTIFAELFDVVVAVAYSTDRKFIATGTINGEIIIWDGLLSKQIEVLKGHQGWVRSVVFHPTNNKIVASGAADHSVRVWNIESGEVQVCIGHVDWVRSVAFSPDGSILASAGSDGKLNLWETTTGQIIKSYINHADWIWSICFSDSGERIFSGSNDGTVCVTNIETNEIQVLRHQNNPIKVVAYSPFGDFVASGGNDNNIYIWNTKAGEIEHVIKGHNDHIWCLKFSHDGKYLFSGSKDKTIKVWSVDDWSIERTLSGQNGYVTSLDTSISANLLVSGGSDQTLRLWDVQTGQCVKHLEGKSNNVNSVSFHPKDNLIAWGGGDHIIHVWDYFEGIHKMSLRGHDSKVKSLSFSHRGELLASGSDDQTVRVWDVSRGAIRHILRGHKAWVFSVAFSPDDKMIASASDDRTILLWDTDTGDAIKRLTGDSYIYSVAFNSLGNIVVSSGADKKIWVWNIETGKPLKTLEGHTLRVNSIACSLKNLIVSGGEDRTVRLWSLDEGRCLGVLNGHVGSIRSVCFDSTGEYIVSCGDDRTARVWNLYGECIAVIENENNYMASAIKRTGEVVALSDVEGFVNFWDRDEKRIKYKLRSKRIYENMNITDATGLTNKQKENLKVLGAFES